MQNHNQPNLDGSHYNYCQYFLSYFNGCIQCFLLCSINIRETTSNRGSLNGS